MKKLPILIPTLVATISVPFMSLMGCSQKSDSPTATTITLSEFDPAFVIGGKQLPVLCTPQQEKYSLNKQYLFVINIQHEEELIWDTEHVNAFILSPDGDDPEEGPIFNLEETTIWVNDKEHILTPDDPDGTKHDYGLDCAAICFYFETSEIIPHLKNGDTIYVSTTFADFNPPEKDSWQFVFSGGIND